MPVMTPQLQLALKLLQLSRVELVDMVREKMLENPSGSLSDGLATIPGLPLRRAEQRSRQRCEIPFMSAPKLRLRILNS